MLNETGPIHAAISRSIRVSAALALLAATVVAGASPAAAQPKSVGATRMFVTIDGVKQSKFKAEGGPQFADRIPILRFNFEVDAPRDVATGAAAGKRQWKPLSITKDWSAASPQLLLAATTNELLKSVLIEVFRTGPGGQEEVVATIRLTNATIGKYTTMVSEANSGDGPAGRLLDRAEFTFQKIEVINPVAKTGVTDDWMAR